MDLAVLAPGGLGAAEHVGDGGGGRGPRPGHVGRRLVLAVEGAAVVPDDEQRPAPGLVDLMLDAATAEIPVPAQPGPEWRADLEELAAQTRQMTRRHPWYAALYHTRPPAGPHMMERLEFMLGVLTGQGASIAEAMTYAAMIDRYILGSALQETGEARMSREHGLDDEAALRSALGTVHDLAAATGRLPRLTGWLAHPSGPPPEEQFSLGLGFLLDGIARCLAGAENPARSAHK